MDPTNFAFFVDAYLLHHFDATMT